MEHCVQVQKYIIVLKLHRSIYKIECQLGLKEIPKHSTGLILGNMLSNYNGIKSESVTDQMTDLGFLNVEL